ncbi:MAG TPA: preprotein translocase subunit SecE [Pseudomonadales bacterium]|nr:preprotein translocase subunit SecE [Pseudomonadales bacterium]
MNTKTEASTSYLDLVKWLVAIGILIGGVYANTVYSTLFLFYRALAGVAIVGVAAAILLTTEQGKAAWSLAKEARVEVRKVVWPSREETTQTTLIVVLVVALVGLLMWGLDSGLSWGVHAVIG